MYNYIRGVHRIGITKSKNISLLFILLICSTIVLAKKAKVFIQSTQGIQGSGGITLQDDGTLLTSSLPKNIRIFDPKLKKFVGNAFIQTSNFYGFFDDQVVFDEGISGGSFLDGRIWTITKSGQTIQSNQDAFQPVPSTGVYAADFSPNLVGIDPVTYRKSNDSLYAASSFNSAYIFKLDWRGSAPEPIQLSVPVAANAFQFGLDDKLYSPDNVNNKIVKIDVDTGLVTDVVTGIPSPIAVKLDSKGIIYTISRNTGQLFKYDPASMNPPTVITTLQPALDNLALNKDETKIYVTNDQNDIFEVDISSGQQKKVFESPIVGPYDLAYDKKSLYIADQGSLKEVNAHTGKLKRILVVDDANSGVTGLGQVNGITVEPGNDGLIIITDTTIGNIFVITKKDFTFVDAFDAFSTGLFTKQPFSAVRVTGGTPAQYYLAVNAVDNTIVKIYRDSANNIITETFLTGLKTPAKLKLYHDKTQNKDFLYIVEAGLLDQAIPNTGRVSRFPLNNPVPEAQEILVDNLNNPQGLDIYNNKMVIVEVGSNRLLKASAIAPSVPKAIQENLRFEYPIVISQFNPKPILPFLGVASSKKGKRIYCNQPTPNNILVIK